MQPAQLPLRDIHLPEAIGWWPPAIGLWLLAVLIPLLIAFLYWLYKRLTRRTAIKTAKNNLAAIKQNPALNNNQKLRELSMLIRRVTISVNPRTEAASLTGRQWLAFLDNSVTGAPFSEGCGQLLAEAPYRNTTPSELEISQLISLCEDWLKAQTLPAKRKQKS
jgi:cbb3-type cytochrome oxidase subunit 3